MTGASLAAAASGMPPVARDLVVATVAVWLAGELLQSQRTRPEATAADRGSRPVIRLAMTAGAVLAAVAHRAVPGASIHPAALAAWAGLVVIWCGVALGFAAFHTLGRYFTFTVQTSPDQPVVTTGPYRVVRHPGYAGALLAVAGVGLVLANWLSLVALVAASAAGIVYRIRIEERALTAEVPGYPAYAAGRARLVPFLR